MAEDIKYNFISPHKCGSTVFRGQVLARLCKDKFVKNFIKNPRTGKEHLGNEESAFLNDKGQVVNISFARGFKSPNANEKLVCVVRNPISMCISMFYSFGFTHGMPGHWTREAWEQNQKKIQQGGLHKFVEDRLGGNAKKISDIFTLDRKKHLVLPYELMINNFESFLRLMLNFINANHFYDEIYNSCKSRFEPIEDQSHKIEKEGLKTHKRTTDIFEWKRKIEKNALEEYFSKYEILEQYQSFLGSFDFK